MSEALKEGSLLLQPGPVEADDVTGDKDLIEVHKLGNIAAAVLSPGFPLGNYEQGLTGPGGRPEWRKGPGMELAPLGNTYPSSNPPSFAPLSPDVLQQAFTLQPGSYQLPEADKGIPVVSALGGAAPPPAAAQPPAQPAAGAGTAAARSFKFKVKLGGGAQ